MGLSTGAFGLLFAIFSVVGALAIVTLVQGCRRLVFALLRDHAMAFVDFTIYLYTRVSKAVSSNFSSASELPHSEIHRRRDLIGGSAMLYEYPGVIPSDDSRSERILNRYGRYLNVYAKIPNTNATVFRVRSWLRNCEQNHNGRNGNPHCQPLDEDGRGYPLWLIDIEQRCVVPFQATLSYFALSYVWGRIETAKMERSNLVQLQQPGSLLGPRQAIELPTTIKDAMFLTGLLGHRYLWCDRLCLVQDDISSKLPQIQQMAEIYARAYCTIVAFDNLDANSGLHGLPILTRCSYPQLVALADTLLPYWSSRAWTFQEELFSVRIIQLSSQAVNWQCSPLREVKSTCGSSHNNSESIRSLQLDSDIGINELGSAVQVGGMFCPRHASLEFYMSLAEKYSQRIVWHPEDRFHAFSSVQSVLKASYPGAFIQGIPESLLVQCLLWETDTDSYIDVVDSIFTRRRASSWSWIGRFFRIYYPRFADKSRTPRHCEGLVSWYVSLKRDSRWYQVSEAKEERWARYRKFDGLSSACMLPLNASSTGKQDMSLGSQGFQHIIPLSADSPEPSTLEVKNLCSYLHGRVLMARLRVHFKDTRVTGEGGPICSLSCETSGNHAGVLRRGTKLSGYEQVASFIAISWSSIEADHCCNHHFELSGLLPEEIVDPITKNNCLYHRKPKKKVYEFYDVLWVEYEDGVAYRKSIGRVRKEVWDRETLGWVDITLG